ncbi:MAG: peptidylprolyl isomerase [Magnetococcales bacterium]|nr:peptidylprolyl isomerase [Magnetococcales bacterium]
MKITHTLSVSIYKFASVSAFALLFFVLSATSVQARMADRIVAVVDDDVVTQTEVEAMARGAIERMGAKLDKGAYRLILKKALDQLVMQRLRAQKAQTYGIEVTESEVDQLMRQVARKNQMTLAGLKSALEMDSVDMDLYREELRDQVIKRQLVQKVIRPLVTVSDQEIADLYQLTNKGGVKPEEVHLGQILVRLSESASSYQVDEAKHKVDLLLTQIRNGESFANLASQYSDDSSGLNGGEIGWFQRGSLSKEMSQVVFGRSVGQVVGPVRTAQGLHILKILDRRNVSASSEKIYRIRASHILIRHGSNSPEKGDARTQIDLLHQRLKKGASFEALAKQYSDDTTAKEGGDLGWFGPGQMVPTFEQVANSLEPGHYSQPVRTEFGWHLILVNEKIEMDPNSLDARKEVLKKQIHEKKTQERYNQWLRDVRMRAFVELH